MVTNFLTVEQKQSHIFAYNYAKGDRCGNALFLLKSGERQAVVSLYCCLLPQQSYLKKSGLEKKTTPRYKSENVQSNQFAVVENNEKSLSDAPRKTSNR